MLTDDLMNIQFSRQILRTEDLGNRYKATDMPLWERPLSPERRTEVLVQMAAAEAAKKAAEAEKYRVKRG